MAKIMNAPANESIRIIVLIVKFGIELIIPSFPIKSFYLRFNHDQNISA